MGYPITVTGCKTECFFLLQCVLQNRDTMPDENREFAFTQRRTWYDSGSERDMREKKEGNDGIDE